MFPRYLGFILILLLSFGMILGATELTGCDNDITDGEYYINSDIDCSASDYFIKVTNNQNNYTLFLDFNGFGINLTDDQNMIELYTTGDFFNSATTSLWIGELNIDENDNSTFVKSSTSGQSATNNINIGDSNIKMYKLTTPLTYNTGINPNQEKLVIAAGSIIDVNYLDSTYTHISNSNVTVQNGSLGNWYTNDTLFLDSDITIRDANLYFSNDNSNDNNIFVSGQGKIILMDEYFDASGSISNDFNLDNQTIYGDINYYNDVNIAETIINDSIVCINQVEATIGDNVKNSCAIIDENIYDAYIDGSDINGAQLFSCIVYDSNIYDSNVYDSNIYDSNLVSVDVNNSNIYNTYISDSDITNSFFYDMYESIISSIDIFYDYISFNFDLNTYDNDMNWNNLYYKYNADNIYETGTDTNQVFTDYNSFDINFNYYLQGFRSSLSNIYYYLVDDNDNTYDPSYPLNGYLFLKFKLESTDLNTIPDSVTFNGTDYTSSIDAYGGLVIDFNSSDSNEHTLIVQKTDYRTRTYNLFLNDANTYDYNIGLVHDDNGESMDFKIYETDQTSLLSNAYVMVFLDTNYNQLVGAKELDADAEATFNLNPNETDYNFHIYAEDGNVYYYGAQPITVKIPLAESNPSTSISPFDITVGGLGAQIYDDQNNDKNILVITDTFGYYDILVTDSNGDYLPSNYSIKLLGNQPYILQPYLVTTTEGITAYFYVKDRSNNRPLEDASVVIKKNVSGSGIVTVQNSVTDSTGTATASLVALDTYYIDFYYEGDKKLSSTIYANTTEYFVYLRIEDDNESSESYVNRGTLINYGSLTTDLNQDDNTISINIDTFGEGISSISVSMENDGNTIYSNDFTTNVYSGYDVNIDFNYDLITDSFEPIEVCVDVNWSGGSYTVCGNILVPDPEFNPIGRLGEWVGDQDHVWQNIIIAFIVLFFVGGLAVTTKSSLPLYIIGISIIGVFAIAGVIEGVSVTVFLIAATIGLFYVLAKGGNR